MSQVGAVRTNVQAIWPSRLEPAKTRLIYLDLNHWIALAKADAGKVDGRKFVPALERLRDLPSSWTCVIGMPLIMELIGIRRRRQSMAIGTLIEEITNFACVMPLTTIAPLEFESALARLVPIQERFQMVLLLGWGVHQAFGLQGGLKIRDEAGNDVTAAARMTSPLGAEEFDRRIQEAELLFNRSVIRGPESEEEERELLDIGWNPPAIKRVAQKRAEQEREFARLLESESRWRRGRLRDVIAARYLALEIIDTANAVTAAHGVRLADVLTSPELARQFIDSMPAADIWTTLRTAKHRNQDSLWRSNDIFDIDALSVAAAYCDIVVTEAHSAHVLRTAAVVDTHGTYVIAKLEELPTLIEAAG